ncbi:MAG: hypothetical protein ABSG41_03220 [Bryobacteraceae bacterium]|jgi:hypothetical protein
MRFLVLPLLFCWCFAGHAQWPGVEFKPEPGTGSLESRYDHAAWTSPESVVRDLRADDDGTRAKALRLFGYPEAEMKDVPKPDQIELRYAAIGDDATLQAIVAITVNVSMAYAAVAVPRAKGWERIGTFFCWCKYESSPLQFVDIRLASSSGRAWSELVLRPSGGGTGVYGRDEAHFRIHNGALRKVISFVSFRRSCQPPDPCMIEARSLSGNTLVQSREQFEADSPPRNATCTPYEWDEKAFTYKRGGPVTKCAKAFMLP